MILLINNYYDNLIEWRSIKKIDLVLQGRTKCVVSSIIRLRLAEEEVVSKTDFFFFTLSFFRSSLAFFFSSIILNLLSFSSSSPAASRALNKLRGSNKAAGSSWLFHQMKDDRRLVLAHR